MAPITANTIATVSVFQVLLTFVMNGLSTAWFIEDNAIPTPASKRTKPPTNRNMAKVVLFNLMLHRCLDYSEVIQI